MPSIRLILDDAGPGDWNMGVDEALLEGAERAESPTLRFYGWTEPTLSLGYFQPLADRAGHAASKPCPVVRRSTGGGAIVHDHELTYSFVLPHAAAGFTHLRAGALPLYQLFHHSLIGVLVNLGIAAEWCQPPVTEKPEQEPFLCFQRRSVGDVVAGAHKLAGSAQRRHGRATLQHGSVLLKASAAAPELLGVIDLLGKAVERERIINFWLEALARTLAVEFVTHSLSEGERTRAEWWRNEQFAAATWVGKR